LHLLFSPNSGASANPIRRLTQLAEYAEFQRKDTLRHIENRAKIFLTMLETGKSSDDELSEQTKITKLEVNRALDELKEIGLINKTENEHSFQVARQTHKTEKEPK
jgi:transcription initiation factor IIE alpha subunit